VAHPPWDETAPAGTAPANTIDDIIRGLKGEIRERMDDIVVDWTDDPVEVKPQSILRTGLILILGPYGMQTEDDEDNAQWPQGKFNNAGSTPKNSRMNIPVQSGWKITKIELMVDRGSSSSLDLGIFKGEFLVSNSYQSIGTLNVTAAGNQIVTLFTGTETVSGNQFYWIEIKGQASSSWFFYGAKIYYDEV